MSTAEIRKLSVERTCSTCGTSTYSVQIVTGNEDDDDGPGEQRFSALPAGWFYFPIDHGDGDDIGSLIMVHEFCSEDCVMQAIHTRDGTPPAQPKPEQKRPAPGPLTASLSDLINKRKT